LGSSVTLAGNGQKHWQFQGFGANVVPKAEVHLGNVGEKVPHLLLQLGIPAAGFADVAVPRLRRQLADGVQE
jgi:hypothetical protein